MKIHKEIKYHYLIKKILKNINNSLSIVEFV